MKLEKWYLDAVFPDGRVWVGYQAWLRLWGCPAIPWVSGREMLPNGQARTVSAWKELAEPRLRNGEWRWRGPDGFAARWEPMERCVESSLGSDDEFRVRWRCLAPQAAVTRTLTNGCAKRAGQNIIACGTGYVEHLELETTRRDVPFRSLWWGHARVGESSLVWIRWGRGRDLCLVLENGVKVPGELETLAQGGVRIRTARGTWGTGTGQKLCDRDVRRAFPRWLVWLARGMAPLREVKIAGPVQLKTDAAEFTGTGLWEEVRWA
jgi:hypothetical protein